MKLWPVGHVSWFINMIQSNTDIPNKLIIIIINNGIINYLGGTLPDRFSNGMLREEVGNA